MRFRRFLSGLLFGLGCALAFIGLMTIVLPAIPNPQLKLVLASFTMPSDNGIVSMMNRFMIFALEQNWRMLGLGALIAAMGMWLIIHFTPKQRKKPAVSQSKDIQPLSSEPIAQPEPEAANPFAVETSRYATPAKPQSKTNSFVVHAQPILERNKIEETAELSADTTPYYSPRFEAESRAIQTEVGAASQSGSRILVRSVYESPAPAEMPVADDPVKVDIPKSEPSTTPAPAPMPPLSPRIRSTMGRHGTIKRNLPTARP